MSRKALHLRSNTHQVGQNSETLNLPKLDFTSPTFRSPKSLNQVISSRRLYSQSHRNLHTEFSGNLPPSFTPPLTHLESKPETTTRVLQNPNPLNVYGSFAHTDSNHPMSRYNNRETFMTINTQESMIEDLELTSRRERNEVGDTPVRRVSTRSRSNQKVKIYGGSRMLNLNPYIVTETITRTVGEESAMSNSRMSFEPSQRLNTLGSMTKSTIPVDFKTKTSKITHVNLQPPADTNNVQVSIINSQLTDIRKQLEIANKRNAELRTENETFKEICQPTEEQLSSDPKIKFLLEKLKAANENISFLANENDILLNKYKLVSKNVHTPHNGQNSDFKESNTLELSRTNFNSPFVDPEKEELIKDNLALKQEIEQLKAQKLISDEQLLTQKKEKKEKKKNKKSKRSKSKTILEPVVERDGETLKILSRNSASNQMINEDAFSAKIIDSLQNELITTKQELVDLKSKYKKIKKRSVSRKEPKKSSKSVRRKDKKKKKSSSELNKYSVENVGYDAKKSQELQQHVMNLVEQYRDE